MSTRVAKSRLPRPQPPSERAADHNDRLCRPVVRVGEFPSVDDSRPHRGEIAMTNHPARSGPADGDAPIVNGELRELPYIADWNSCRIRDGCDACYRTATRTNGFRPLRECLGVRGDGG
jgi:hypothetical protein